MTALLLPSEETHLTSWANWMGACTKKMYSLDRNIPFINKPQWSWDEVIESLAFLEAFRTDVQILLMKHGVDLDA
jgi:hypothetical protein